MRAGQLVSNTARAASAGLRKLWPRPPKSCLTMMMANALPTAGSHSGAEEGRFRPSSRPVTTADRSFTVTFCPDSFCHRASAITADATAMASIQAARRPNRYRPAAVAGSSAMRTSSIIPCVFSRARICGPVERRSFILTTSLQQAVLWRFSAKRPASAGQGIHRSSFRRGCSP